MYPFNFIPTFSFKYSLQRFKAASLLSFIKTFPDLNFRAPISFFSLNETSFPFQLKGLSFLPYSEYSVFNIFGLSYFLKNGGKFFLFFFLCFVTTDIFSQNNISFNSSGLAGENLVNPTSLQFGPDNRLYVSQQNGSIFAYTIQKNGPNNYQVTSTETIDLVKETPNHNDDGTLHTTKVQRQITGILVVGSAATPVLYVTSSDYRIGGGGTKGDLNLDTNSGIISKLTWTGSNWDKVDLVRGLPRSEENHSNNGLQLNSSENKLYIAMGGNTNAGSPSNNFAFLTEYALSAAIITVDLTVIESLPIRGTGNNKYVYDLPTLDDPSRPNVINPDYNASLPGSLQTKDENDPFGGNDGLNQAKIVPNGPVQIHSPGYRNAYDLVFTKSPGKEGKLYTIDNGPNGGWGGYPENEGAFGNPLTTSVTNNYVPGEPGSTGPGVNDAKVNNKDNLHLVSGPGMQPIYGGHPCPIRANPSGAGLYWYDNVTELGHFDLNPTVDWPPVPLSNANPIEGDYQNPGVNDNALYTWATSTNGLAEYTSSKFFGGEMVGDLLAASYDGEIYRIKLNSSGTAVISSEVLANGFGSNPLDLVSPGPGKMFEGTIWAATYGANAITIFEPEGGSSWQNLPSSDSSTPTARHENGYVEAGGKFFLIGGRGNRPMEIYDPVSNTWTTGATPPLQFHHFQAIEFEGLIYVMGAFVGSFPSETPVPNIYIYNPATNIWTMGPAIPSARRRGSAGVVKYNNKIYMVGGIINGHTNGWVSWLDEYNPSTGTWTQLPDAPRERDHFQAVQINGKIYAAAGRQSGKIGTFVPMIAEVDVYDFNTNAWSTLPSSANLPTLRAGTSAVSFNNELLIIGGESTQQTAHNETQALDLTSNTWRSLAPLNTGRHGTQAIVHNGNIYITAGSGGQGSNPELNTQETFVNMSTTCTGDNENYSLDDDNDGYSNGDETDNGTNPCSAASVPSDHDLDFLSDLNDPDDDNDGLLDTTDKFALDSQNGINKNIPIDYPFLNGVPGTGLFGLGFTGLMTNNTSNYDDLYDPEHPDLIMGGAVGLASLEANSGDALNNNQQNGFQFGVNVNSNSPTFTIQSRILGAPYFNGIPINQLGNQSLGIFIGTGDQNNYLKVVLAANNGNPGIQILAESGGSVVSNNIFPISNILQSSEIDVFLEVDPQTGMIQPKYALDGSSAGIDVGPAILASGPLLNVIQNAPALAVGLISTSGASSPFIATWDYINIYSENLIADARINAGGASFTFNDEDWQADQFSDGGSTYTNNIAIESTTNDKLYQTERSGTTFNYNIPVNGPGTYVVRLHFAEIYHGVKNPNGVGARIFNVNVENNQGQLQNYDIIQKAGGPAKAVVETFANIIVNDGSLTLAFSTVKNKAKISGIEVFAAGEPTNLPPVVVNPGNQTYNEGQAVNLPIEASDPDGDPFTFSQTGLPASLNINSNTGLISGTIEASAGEYPVIITVTDNSNLSSQIAFNISITGGSSTVSIYRINSGGTAYAFNSESWQNDQFSDAGGTYTNNIEIAATTNDQLYKSERSGTTFNYNLPVSGPGPFTVKLHFAEIFHGVKNTNGIGARIFNVDVENGQAQLQNYDIIAQAGQPATAVVETFSDISVNDGNLTLAFTTIKNRAKISGIEILSSGSTTNQPPLVTNPGSQIYTEGQTVNLQIQASDPNGDAITFSQTGLPASLNLATTTGLISGTVSATGDFPVTVTVSDGQLSAQTFFNITVNGGTTNEAPVLAAIGNQSIAEDASYDVNISASDPDGDPLEISITDLPTFATFVDNSNGTALLSLSPGLGDAGDYPVTITATDPGLLSDSENIVITVTDGSVSMLYHINSGGPSFIFNGESWDADQLADGGSTYVNNIPIAGTTNDQLYISERSGITFNYNIPVSNPGLYVIRLHFAEIFHGVKNANGVGARIFNVNIENGQGQLQNYDIIERAGGTATAIIETFSNINVSDGNLNLAFTTVKNKAKVSGIEVIENAGNATAMSNQSGMIATKNLSFVEKNSENEIKIYPNPTPARFKIRIIANEEENISISLFNDLGRKVKLGDYSLKPGASVLEIDTAPLNLNSGLYYLKIDSAKKNPKVLKLFISR